MDKIRLISDATGSATNEPAATPKRQRNKLNGVTHKEEAFIQGVLEGRTKSEAYRRAYDVSPNSKPTTSSVAASRLLQRPNVIARIEQLQEEKEEQRRLMSLTMHERILEGLEGLATDKSNAARDRITAYTKMGQSIGMFKDVVETKDSTDKSLAELELELKDLLRNRLK